MRARVWLVILLLLLTLAQADQYRKSIANFRQLLRDEAAKQIQRAQNDIWRLRKTEPTTSPATSLPTTVISTMPSLPLVTKQTTHALSTTPATSSATEKVTTFSAECDQIGLVSPALGVTFIIVISFLAVLCVACCYLRMSLLEPQSIPSTPPPAPPRTVSEYGDYVRLEEAHSDHEI